MKQSLAFVGGIALKDDGSVSNGASWRDLLGVELKAKGALDGITRGRVQDVFSSGAVPRRIVQWRNTGTPRTIRAAAYPSDAIQSTGSGGPYTGPTGDAIGCEYAHLLPLAISGDQCIVMVNSAGADPFTSGYCYLGHTVIEAAITLETDLGATYKLNVSTAGPNYALPAGYEPIYVLFETDAYDGATSATVRAVANYHTTGGVIDWVEYTGDAPPADTAYARMIIGTSATDTFKPDGFFIWQNRLCAWKDNTVFMSGYQGNESPFIEPNIEDWTHWYAPNQITLGNSAQGSITACKVVNDVLIATLERAVWRAYGDLPINGAIENVIKVEEVVGEYGAASFDHVTLSSDGSAVYFYGSNGNLYVTNGQTPVMVSGEIYQHEKYRDIAMLCSVDQYVVFTSLDAAPELVARESLSQPSGLLMQYPCAFMLDTADNEWSTFQPLTATAGGLLRPFDDPARGGGIFPYYLDGRYYFAVGVDGGVRLLQDQRRGVPAATDYYISGAVTHGIALGGTGLKQIVGMELIAEAPASTRLSAAAPIIKGAMDQASVATAAPRRSQGDDKVFDLYFKASPPVNYMRCGFGYMGEHLIDGASSWPLQRNDFALSGTVRLCPFTFDGSLSRIDVLFNTVTSCHLAIYADNAGAPDTGTLVFAADLEEAEHGFVGTGEYWHSFNIRKTMESAQYWIGLTGSGNVRYKSSSKDIVSSANAVVQGNAEWMLRCVREIGAPFAARRMRNLSVDVKPLSERSSW